MPGRVSPPASAVDMGSKAEVRAADQVAPEHPCLKWAADRAYDMKWEKEMTKVHTPNPAAALLFTHSTTLLTPRFRRLPPRAGILRPERTLPSRVMLTRPTWSLAELTQRFKHESMLIPISASSTAIFSTPW